jgi:DNA/RNA-binding protein KIN17
MAKHDFLTPKAIANRIKAKGLQRLRWYCQMCEKQCRDENGFKCHCMSESHQRQMSLFTENPGKFMNSYTNQFKNDFLTLLKRQFGGRRVFANMVYQEYIKDRQHIHMNATTWATLNDFVKYLGREGICTVEETERGWFITYIDRSPETLTRIAAKEKKVQMEMDDEERHKRFIEQQIERATLTTCLEKDEDMNLPLSKTPENKVTFNLGKKVIDPTITNKKLSNIFENEELEPKQNLDSVNESLKRKASDVPLKHQEPRSRRDDWLQKGLIVKRKGRS